MKSSVHMTPVRYINIPIFRRKQTIMLKVNAEMRPKMGLIRFSAPPIGLPVAYYPSDRSGGEPCATVTSGLSLSSAAGL